MHKSLKEPSQSVPLYVKYMYIALYQTFRYDALYMFYVP